MLTSKICLAVGTLALGLVLSLTLPLAWAQPAYACPLCAEQVGKQEAGKYSGNPSAGYNYSIFAMIGILLAVGVGMGRLMYVVVKQTDAEALAAMPAQNPPPVPPTGERPASA